MEFGFPIKKKNIKVFIAKDGFIEVYEKKNPGKTGFYLENIKELNLLINGLTDIAEKIQEEEI